MNGSRALPEPLLRFLEHAARRLLEMDPERGSELRAIAGKAIAIEFPGVGTRMILLPQDDGLRLVATHEGPVHVTVRAAPLDMLGYLAGSAPAAGGGLEITGDVAVAEKLQDVLKGLDPDWEEALSGRIGDTAARKLGNFIRGAAGWVRGSGRATVLDIDEYLRFEAQAVPGRDEVGRFVAAVDLLRDDVERLRARLDRLGRGAVAGGH